MIRFYDPEDLPRNGYQRIGDVLESQYKTGKIRPIQITFSPPPGASLCDWVCGLTQINEALGRVTRALVTEILEVPDGPGAGAGRINSAG